MGGSVGQWLFWKSALLADWSLIFSVVFWWTYNKMVGKKKGRR